MNNRRTLQQLPIEVLLNTGVRRRMKDSNGTIYAETGRGPMVRLTPKPGPVTHRYGHKLTPRRILRFLSEQKRHELRPHPAA